MALSKIQAESMNLADTYAFTGTVTGTPSGAWNLLNTQTASASSTINFSSTYITNEYNHHVIICENATFSIDGADGEIQFSADNGSSFLANGSKFNQLAYDSTFRTEGPIVSQSNMRTFSSVDGDNANNNGIGSFIIHMFNLPSTTDKKQCWFEILNHTQNGDAGKYLIGQYGFDTLSAINYVRFALNNGNYATGNFKLYGVS